MVNTKNTDRYLRAERIQKQIDAIRGYATAARAAVPDWRMAYGDFRGPESPAFDLSGWDILPRGRDTYGGRNTYFWFCTHLTIPAEFKGKPVRLNVSTHPRHGWDPSNPNFIVFLDGQIASAFDKNHRELLLTNEAAGGETIYVALKGFTAMQDCRLSFDTWLSVHNPAIDRLYYDIKVPLDVAALLDDGLRSKNEMLYLLNEAVNHFEMTEPGSPAFFDGIAAAQQYMDTQFYGDFCRREPEVYAHCIGHTHLDVAWLWPMRQTREKTARTFANMLKLMEEYPDFQFMSSQACIYNWIREDYPELFARMKDAVRAGRWEVEGGMWVEADCNLTSGEGFVRQFLYGKRFFQREFGVDCKILWLPDVFGYSAALPQILKKCGIDYFMTTKIAWNNYDKIPYDTFTWQGIDGSTVFSHFITCTEHKTARSGSSFTTYNANLNASQMLGSWERFQQKDICNEVLCSIGWGDGGGGTDREMLENGLRLARGIPGAPQVHWDSARAYFDHWSQSLSGNRFLPRWVGELYLEFHRGTLTTMADNKRDNRKSELLYQNAELFAYLDALLLGHAYPKELFDRNWEIILTNQFHDILPGSSIREVYEDSARDYAAVLHKGRAALDASRSALVQQLQTHQDSVVVFNETGLDNRCGCAAIDGLYRVFDTDGTPLPVQHDGGKTTFISGKVPAKGWAAFALAPAAAEADTQPTAVIDGSFVSTPYYRAELDGRGEFVSLVDRAGREYCASGKALNHLVAYVDIPYEHDAWEVAPYYPEQPYEPDVLSSAWVSNGPVSATLRTVRRYNRSEIVQYLTFYAHNPRIDVYNEIDWQEDNTLLRVHNATTVHANAATYDIQFGNLTRETHQNTSWEFAKFEVCGHKWADISDSGYGFALLNDSKYGYRCLENDLSLSLLRAPTSPNPVADRGVHRFTYALLPHDGAYAEGGVIAQGYRLNCPLETMYAAANPNGTLPAAYALVRCNAANVILGAVKRAEDDNRLVVRLNEEENTRTDAVLTFARPVASAEIVSLTEDTVYSVLRPEGAVVRLPVQPYEIVTLRVDFA